MFKKYITELLISGLAILAGVSAILYTIGFLMFIDLVLGIWVAYKKREDISSKKMSMSVSKGIVYNLFIISSFLIEKFIIPQLPFLEISSGFIALIELKSISESADYLTGINLFSVIKKIFLRSQNVVSQDVANDISKIIDEETKKD